jgi:DNA-binding Lrp family transcriptional regulator
MQKPGSAGRVSKPSAARKKCGTAEVQPQEMNHLAKVYLKLDLETGKENDVKTALKKVAGVKSADFVTGAHDLIATIEAKSFEDVVTKTLPEVRKIKGIKKTITDFAFEWA